MTSARAACGALAPKAALEPSRAAGPVKGRNGRPAQEIGGGLSGRFFDPRGWTVTARLRLFKDDNFLPGGYFALDRHGVRHEIAGWSPAAAERHGRELMGRLLARGAIAARDVSVCASHERVHSPSGQHWLPTARATERDGHALYWAQRAAAIPTEPLPRGEPAFERGYRQARREFGWLTGLALTQQALTVAGLAATPIRLGSGYSIVDARSGHRIRYDWNGPRGGRERHAHGEVITATGIRGDGGVAGQVVLRPTPGSGRVGGGARAETGVTVPPAHPRIVRQQLQQPQLQAPATRSGGSADEGSPARRLRAYRQLAGDSDHLVAKRTTGGEPRLGVDTGALFGAARAAHDRLIERFGEPVIERMLGALVLGRGGEVGLHALAIAWRAHVSSEPLSGDTLGDLGRVVTNRPEFGTLNDLAGLVGFHVDRGTAGSAPSAGPYHGIYPPTWDGDTARQYLVGPARDGLRHLQGLPVVAPTKQDLLDSALMLQHLRELQLAYDAGRSDGLYRPWEDGQSANFVASLAAQVAFWYALRAGSAGDAASPPLRDGEHRPWGEVAQRLAGLKTLDFAVDYPRIESAMRDALRQLLAPFDPMVALAESVVRASSIANATFTDPSLRQQLLQTLVNEYIDPRAMSAHQRTPQFEQSAQRLVLDRLQAQAQFELPWIREQVRDAALRWAADRAVAPTPRAQLIELERLLTAPNLKAEREALLSTYRSRELRDRRLFATLDEIVRAHGSGQAQAVEPARFASARTFDEALVTLLASGGIRAEVRHDPYRRLWVEPPRSDSWWERRREAERISALMNQICWHLTIEGHPTRWDF
jgi:hypothetical protein